MLPSFLYIEIDIDFVIDLLLILKIRERGEDNCGGRWGAGINKKKGMIRQNPLVFTVVFNCSENRSIDLLEQF